jgi:hypothetical protein
MRFQIINKSGKYFRNKNWNDGLGVSRKTKSQSRLVTLQGSNLVISNSIEKKWNRSYNYGDSVPVAVVAATVSLAEDEDRLRANVEVDPELCVPLLVWFVDETLADLKELSLV